MIIFDDVREENRNERKPSWPPISDCPFRILLISGSETRKANALLDLVINQPHVDYIYLYVKDPFEAKYQLLIKKCKNVGLTYCNNFKAFTEYFNDINNIDKKTEKYNLNKRQNFDILDDMMLI